MSTSFAGSMNISMTGSLTGTSNLSGASSGHNTNYSQAVTYTNGTGANQSNMQWSDTRTLAASTSENLDLAGVLTNAFGSTITFTSIKGIIISASSSNTNNVLVGGAASNVAFASIFGDSTDILVLKPGATFALETGAASGYAVTASTGDILKVANSSSGTSVTYDIIVIGTV